VEKATRPNLVEAFFVKRDLPPDHPDVLAQMRYRCMTKRPPAESWWVQKLSADFTAD
jgi:hypothetical protein